MRSRAVAILFATLAGSVGWVPARGVPPYVAKRAEAEFVVSPWEAIRVRVSPESWILQRFDTEDDCETQGTFPPNQPGTDGLTFARLSVVTECGAVDLTWAPGDLSAGPVVAPHVFHPGLCWVDGRPPKPGVFIGAGAWADVDVSAYRYARVSGSVGSQDMSGATAWLETHAADTAGGGVTVFPCFPWV